MKEYEAIEEKRKLIKLLPVKGFSKFTKGLQRPYDQRMSDLMIVTTKFFVKQTNANNPALIFISALDYEDS